MTGDVRKGQIWYWWGVRCEILRVARDGTWADLRVGGGMETWTKRQPLPFPSDFRQKLHLCVLCLMPWESMATRSDARCCTGCREGCLCALPPGELAARRKVYRERTP